MGNEFPKAFDFGWHDWKGAFSIKGEIGRHRACCVDGFPMDCHRALMVPFFVCSCRITAKEPVRTIPSTAHMRSHVLIHERSCRIIFARAARVGGSRIVKVYDSWKLGADRFFTSFSSHLVHHLHVDYKLLSLSCFNRMKEMAWMEMSWATPTQFRKLGWLVPLLSNSQVYKKRQQTLFSA